MLTTQSTIFYGSRSNPIAPVAGSWSMGDNGAQSSGALFYNSSATDVYNSLLSMGYFSDGNFSVTALSGGVGYIIDWTGGFDPTPFALTVDAGSDLAQAADLPVITLVQSGSAGTAVTPNYTRASVPAVNTPPTVAIDQLDLSTCSIGDNFNLNLCIDPSCSSHFPWSITLYDLGSTDLASIQSVCNSYYGSYPPVVSMTSAGVYTIQYDPYYYNVGTAGIISYTGSGSPTVTRIQSPVAAVQQYQQDTLTFSAVPNGGSVDIKVWLNGSVLRTHTLTWGETAASLQSDLEGDLATLTVTGDFTSGFTITWNDNGNYFAYDGSPPADTYYTFANNSLVSGAQPTIYNVYLDDSPTNGSWTPNVNSTPGTSLAYNHNATDLQNSLNNAIGSWSVTGTGTVSDPCVCTSDNNSYSLTVSTNALTKPLTIEIDDTGWATEMDLTSKAFTKFDIYTPPSGVNRRRKVFGLNF